MSRWDWYDYTPTKPIATRGGIKSKAKGGVNWWSKRWYEFMETFRLGARLARGKAYARKGQVIDVSIEPGLVKGAVQGSRKTPYKVTIKFPQISQEGWERIVARLKEQIFLSAQLTSGEVPQELEDFFQKEGASLFPQLRSVDDMDCSCPDWSNPCKHIAALFYVLGDAFDRDPFLLLQLRGMTRESLMKLLGDVSPNESDTLEEALPDTEPLPCGEHFYKGASPVDNFWGPLPRTTDISLLRRLGDLPFWRGEQPLIESVRVIYEEAAKRGRAIVTGENIL
jgi:uncharacterized Zn finger protein